MKFFNLFIIASVLVAINIAADLPSFLHVCHKKEPDMLKCFQNAGENLKPHLATGVPEYNIPSMEPLVIDELITEGAENLRLTTTDVKAWGCTDFFIRGANIDLENQKYELDVDLPMLRIEARYNVTGKILVMPVRGAGPMQANVTDCKAKAVLYGELYDEGGEPHLKYTKMTLKVDVGGGKVKVENLFNGDKMLNDAVNDAINKNLGAFLKETMPVVENALASRIMDFANKIVNPFTYDQLFPN